MNIMKISVTGLVALTVISCSSTPEKHNAVEQARADYDRIAAKSYVQQHAPEELTDAERAVARAEESWQQNEDDDIVNHYAYVAERRVAVAEEAANLGRAEKAIANAETERQQVLLEIRETQASRAQTRAEQAETRAQQLEQSLAALEGEMETLKTEETDEGIVLTLQDILFNTNEANLKPNAARTLDRVASFLNNYEQRQLEVNGFTDSTGSAEYNQGLSERRAQSVREALVVRGVNPARINIQGHGEEYPVASNDTASGRQQNRRVEILIANPE